MTMFSIITATHNSAATIADCLASVRSQTVPVEHLIIDGASADDTLQIVTNFHTSVIVDQGVSCAPCPVPCARIISEPDRGIYDAMNKGLGLATGEIIGILNSDDVYADDRVLERVATVFEDPEVEACYGDLVYIRGPGTGGRGSGKTEAVEGHRVKGDGENLSPFTVVRYWKSGYFSPDRFYWGWMPPHPTFFVRRSVYQRYGLFNLELGSAADYELMLRLLLRHSIKVAYVPEVLVMMRAGGASNASIAARLRANLMDRRAWELNSLQPRPWTLFCKPIRKLPQWWRRP